MAAAMEGSMHLTKGSRLIGKRQKLWYVLPTPGPPGIFAASS